MLLLKLFLNVRNMNLCDCCYLLQGQLPELSETDLAAFKEAGCPPQECSAIMGGGMQHSRATKALLVSILSGLAYEDKDNADNM